MITKEGDFGAAIRRVIEENAEEIVKEEAEKASERVATRLREMVGQIVARVAETYEYHRMGNVLTIRVELPNNTDGKGKR